MPDICDIVMNGFTTVVPALHVISTEAYRFLSQMHYFTQRLITIKGGYNCVENICENQQENGFINNRGHAITFTVLSRADDTGSACYAQDLDNGGTTAKLVSINLASLSNCGSNCHRMT